MNIYAVFLSTLFISFALASEMEENNKENDLVTLFTLMHLNKSQEAIKTNVPNNKDTHPSIVSCPQQHPLNSDDLFKDEDTTLKHIIPAAEPTTFTNELIGVQDNKHNKELANFIGDDF